MGRKVVRNLVGECWAEGEADRNLVVAEATALTQKEAEKLQEQEARYVRVVEELRDCSLCKIAETPNANAFV